MSLQKHLRSQIISAIRTYNTSEEQLDAFLEDLLTPSEIQAMDERLSVIKWLLSDKTQREIAEDLGISVTTVSRGSRILQYGRLGESGWQK